MGFVGFVIALVGIDSMADGSAGQQGLEATLQQMIAEQQAQRAQMQDLAQAVQGAQGGLQMTQTVTEAVVQQVVGQVQASFAQEQQRQQDNLGQVAQAHQQTQEQLTQVGATLRLMQSQIQQMSQFAAGTASGAAGSGQGTPRAATGGHQPTSPQPAVGGQPGVPVYNMAGVGGGSPGGGGGVRTSPAVAYAIQQGGVDGKQLGRPGNFNPADSKVSFLDWADSIITLSDSNMPGIYEILEWIMHEQPKTGVVLADLLVKFPALDPLLVQYGDTQIYAVLSSYTSGEARSLVRQARRPNGYEAFRLLNARFNPSTIGRQRADLMRITNPQANIGMDRLAAEVVNWENLIVQYESRPGSERVSAGMKMAALVHMAPSALKQHLHMNVARYTTYLELREEIMGYIEQVSPAATSTMDVGSVGVVKGGGCFICGGPHLQRDCKKGKDKGKGGFKGKGPGTWSKGKGKGGDKGGGKGAGKVGRKAVGKREAVSIVASQGTPRINAGVSLSH